MQAHTGYLACLVMGLCCAGGAAAGTRPNIVESAAGTSLVGSRPNIVFFLADDQSQFDYSAYGNENVPTPTTDAFAKEGLIFERAYTGQAICAPSRSMLYTGLYPIRSGCFINHTAIRPGVKTLPAYLGRLGYEVILAGKSHVQPSDQFEWTHWFQPVKKRGLPRPSIPIDQIGGYFAKADKPFCMMVTSEYPHGPYFEETPFAPADVKLQPFTPDTEANRKHAARYYASIAEKEREFAALLDLLEKNGLTDKTIVFYAADHGVFRGKFTVYDSGLKVPFMVRWPGKIKPKRTDALISFADFVPTVMELAGGETPADLDGRSLLPVLEGRSRNHHEYVYGVAHSQGIQRRHVFPQRSVHDGRYHYIFNFNSLERLAREKAAGVEVDYFLRRGAEKHRSQPEQELFDTLNDPDELKNLARMPEVAAIKARLKRELFQWMESQNDYLTEDGPVPFLKVKLHRLDESQEQFNYFVPEELSGSLQGRMRDPHKITAR